MWFNKDMTPSPFFIRVGPNGNLQKLAEVRTVAQRAAIIQIVMRDDFAFAHLNPCQDNVNPNYAGPFNFHWQDTSGKLHVVRIGKNGNTLSER